MSLPININELIHGNTIESERIEFKEGWNPEPIMHSICAFANDFNNWGGGYIIIGIAEKEGKPILPPKGLTHEQAEKIQKELLKICHKLKPNYFPKIEDVVFQNKLILILWVPGGQDRPYTSPISLSKNSRYVPYIRKFNSTVKANREEEHELIRFSTIPFDDRVNYQRDINDLKLPLIQSFLKETDSELYTQSAKISFEQLCRQLEIIDGSKEYLKPKNVGLMFFNDHPENIFPNSQIEIVQFTKDASDKKLTEKIFEGPIHRQLQDALTYLKNVVIKENIEKFTDKAEAQRTFNYPYAAIEEALVNAIYHRSYELREPVEVRMYSNRIEILSYPGPDSGISKKDLQEGAVVARRYRNRRIGDFLKELKLTEGRCTGIPTIIKSMKDNGSPKAIFKTDESRTYFITTLPIQSKVGSKVQILSYCIVPKKRSEIFKYIGLTNQTKNFNSQILPLITVGYLELTIPNKPNSINQKYKTTKKALKSFDI